MKKFSIQNLVILINNEKVNITCLEYKSEKYILYSNENIEDNNIDKELFSKMEFKEEIQLTPKKKYNELHLNILPNKENKLFTLTHNNNSVYYLKNVKNIIINNNYLYLILFNGLLLKPKNIVKNNLVDDILSKKASTSDNRKEVLEEINIESNVETNNINLLKNINIINSIESNIPEKDNISKLQELDNKKEENIEKNSEILELKIIKEIDDKKNLEIKMDKTITDNIAYSKDTVETITENKSVSFETDSKTKSIKTNVKPDLNYKLEAKEIECKDSIEFKSESIENISESKIKEDIKKIDIVNNFNSNINDIVNHTDYCNKNINNLNTIENNNDNLKTIDINNNDINNLNTIENNDDNLKTININNNYSNKEIQLDTLKTDLTNNNISENIVLNITKCDTNDNISNKEFIANKNNILDNEIFNLENILSDFNKLFKFNDNISEIKEEKLKSNVKIDKISNVKENVIKEPIQKTVIPLENNIYTIKLNYQNNIYNMIALKIISSNNLNFLNLYKTEVPKLNIINKYNLILELEKENSSYLINYMNIKYLINKINNMVIITNLINKHSQVIKNKENFKLGTNDFILYNDCTIIIPMMAKKIYDNNYGTSYNLYMPIL